MALGKTQAPKVDKYYPQIFPHNYKFKKCPGKGPRTPFSLGGYSISPKPPGRSAAETSNDTYKFEKHWVRALCSK